MQIYFDPIFHIRGTQKTHQNMFLTQLVHIHNKGLITKKLL